ncbi:hypothetical protein V490_01783 [Pseudogymnoascus sp. VKM F-3557]|nr:hypothetical protein V490_01783 [Pseudogymnoascus sp. VKM F-3557]
MSSNLEPRTGYLPLSRFDNSFTYADFESPTQQRLPSITRHTASPLSTLHPDPSGTPTLLGRRLDGHGNAVKWFIPHGTAFRGHTMGVFSSRITTLLDERYY